MRHAVSILVPTYARTALLCEVLECFIRQTAHADSDLELIILNDCAGQVLQCHLPQVRVINLGARCVNLSDKRNALLSLARHPLVSFWDDDDIYLPERISRGIELLAGRNFSREREMLHDRGDGSPLVRRQVTPLATLLIERASIDRIGGLRALPDEGDDGLLARLARALLLHGDDGGTAGSPTVIYRSNHGHVRMSNEANPFAALECDARAKIAQGIEPHGEVVLTPHWSRDWSALAAEATP